MEKTKDMKEREECLGNKWKDEGEGYFSIVGSSAAGVMSAMARTGGGSGCVAYIALPKGHKDIGKSYDDLDPEVNGGLTFGEGNVFGWDYAHFQNVGSPQEHIKNALKYFRKREKSKSKKK